MPIKRLTATGVDKLRPLASGQIEYFDELLPSFGLRISHAGTKAWFVTLRVNRKLARITLGRYPAIDLTAARKLARDAIALAAEGIDPRHAEEEKRLKNKRDLENTFGKLAEEFTVKHVGPNLKPTTQREYRRILFGNDTEKWRRRSVSSIRKRDIIDLMDAIDERGARSASALSLAYLRKFFNWCVEREIIDASPIDRVRLERKLLSRERVLSDDEIKIVWNAFDTEGGLFGSFFKLLLLTGQRRNEVAGMRWDELRDMDTHDAIWEIPSERTKNRRTHLVPLTESMRAIITGQDHIGPYVFTSTGETPISGFSKSKARADLKISKTIVNDGLPAMPDWTLHDMRRTMVTVMNEKLGIAPHIVEAVVNHVTGGAKAGVAGVYNRALYLDERRSALQLWSKYIEEQTV